MRALPFTGSSCCKRSLKLTQHSRCSISTCAWLQASPEIKCLALPVLVQNTSLYIQQISSYQNSPQSIHKVYHHSLRKRNRSPFISGTHLHYSSVINAHGFHLLNTSHVSISPSVTAILIKPFLYHSYPFILKFIFYLLIFLHSICRVHEISSFSKVKGNVFILNSGPHTAPFLISKKAFVRLPCLQQTSTTAKMF